MRIKVRYILIAWVVMVLLILWGMTSEASLNSRVKLTGCEVGTRSYSIWGLTQYRDTTMMRRSPLMWCPFRAHVLVRKYVQIDCRDNRNWIDVKANLIELLSDHVSYNRDFAKRFKVFGSKKNQLWQIFLYCNHTKHVLHVKYAKDVFERHEGDCAAIAAALYVLCKAKKIPVRYVIGWKSGGCHAWNRVKVNGKWYWVDATFGLWLQRKQFKGRKVLEMW